MINFDCITKEIIGDHNTIWLQISDNLNKLLITGGSESGKTNSLFNLISKESDNDKIYLYAYYPYEVKYQLLINKKEVQA